MAFAMSEYTPWHPPLRTRAKAAPTDEAQAQSWRSRVLVANGAHGRLAVAHLAALRNNTALAKTAHRWLFDTFEIVMGDFNAIHAQMLDVSVDAVTHVHATMPSYLPSVDYPVAAMPPSFDQVVVRRPLHVELAKRQVWRLQRVKQFPRKQMASRGIPSDHVPVEALVRTASVQSEALRLATWNVADPFYYAQHHAAASAAVGFLVDFEDQRLRMVMDTIARLMERNHVLGLQEVPKCIEDDVVALAKGRRWSGVGLPTPAAADGEGGDAPRMFLLTAPNSGWTPETQPGW